MSTITQEVEQDTISLQVKIPKSLQTRIRVRAAELDSTVQKLIIEAIEAFIGLPSKSRH